MRKTGAHDAGMEATTKLLKAAPPLTTDEDVVSASVGDRPLEIQHRPPLAGRAVGGELVIS
jgi:hypothetical protein